MKLIILYQTLIYFVPISQRSTYYCNKIYTDTMYLDILDVSVDVQNKKNKHYLQTTAGLLQEMRLMPETYVFLKHQ